MRPRMKRSAVYHAAPEASHCFMAKSEVLNNKLKRGTITLEELNELAEIRASRRIKCINAECIGTEYTKKVTESHPKTVDVLLFGTFKMTVTWDEYQERFKHLGF